ncbi:hypothetical protein LR48_Vigan09g027400 [Vigna angularis]|uniref:Thioredoxin H-type 1 n=2 Tax=Phaseolus angularis TaxID=3914 RepID=A0A0L9V943_PHAAN|nr:thioredoxin H-type 2 [Vigna angularis]KAG2400659.1 Thioredoxin H-type 1 [Vigna angularis]KOM51615.1 hypothetical protein LR48_Vigan09g027400 [Vigna angularis]BAT77733.1 hypothetical protein VIGAN_02032800 [Vigna angularis var. angularis]
MAEEGQVIGVHSVSEWKEHLQKGKETGKLIVVDFTASWCGPCRFIGPVLVEIAKKMTHVTFLKVDVDELESVSREWEIEAMPTFLFLKEGKLVDKVVGAKKEELHAKIIEHANAAAGSSI